MNIYIHAVIRKMAVMRRMCKQGLSSRKIGVDNSL